jgi:hypothetical protein
MVHTKMPTLLTTLLILLTGVLIARVSAGRLVAWAVPTIVLELLVGFILGNTVLPFDAIKPLSGITELGVLTLFFQVGLEVRGDLLTSRRASILRTVAISFLAPLLAYWPLRQLFGMAPPETLLCLAVLSATGTGVTLRVLALGNALQTPSGRLLVGVSVLDDLPAIALLSVAMASAGLPMGGAGLAGPGPLLGLALAALISLAVGLWARHRPERPTPDAQRRAWNGREGPTPAASTATGNRRRRASSPRQCESGGRAGRAPRHPLPGKALDQSAEEQVEEAARGQGHDVPGRGRRRNFRERAKQRVLGLSASTRHATKDAELCSSARLF